MFRMERLHQLRTEKVLDCSCKQLVQSFLRQDDRMPHRTQQICYRSCSYSTRTSFYQQAMWLAVLICSCFSVALAQSLTMEVTESVLSTTSTNLDVTTYDSTYTPTPPTFNYPECRNSMDTSEQIIYICRENPELFYILKFAESLAKRMCENEFKHELWNCSGFSILHEPKLTRSENMFKESAYVYSISLAAIAHTVAKACSSQVISQCGCEDGESGCLDNVNHALQVAETFLNKRYGRQGKTLNIGLIHHNLAAAKQHIHYLINTSDTVCKCHGVSGSCSIRTCLPEFPSFTLISATLRNAYNNACLVLPNGQSRNVWLSNCSRNYTDMDLLFRDKFNWCKHKPSIGSLGTVGRECNTISGSSNSCEKICSQCERGHAEHYLEQETKCDCQFHFCCEIQCSVCTERRTYYSCSSS